MKKVIIGFGISVLFLITACKSEVTEHIVSKNSDKGLLINVWGERSSTLEPWTVYIATDYMADRDTIFTELQADKVDSSNVKFNWKDDTNCIIDLKHRDGEVSAVPVLIHVK